LNPRSTRSFEGAEGGGDVSPWPARWKVGAGKRP
jgi:hypothetical protein